MVEIFALILSAVCIIALAFLVWLTLRQFDKERLEWQTERNKLIDRVQAGSLTEFTAQERNIVSQIQDFVTNIANTEGVDLMQNRSLLERILKYLQKSLTGSAKPEAGEEQ